MACGQLSILAIVALFSTFMQSPGRSDERTAKLEAKLPATADGIRLRYPWQLNKARSLALAYYENKQLEKLDKLLSDYDVLAAAYDAEGNKALAMTIKTSLGELLTTGLNRHKEAVELLTSVVESAPETPTAAFHLARAYDRLKEYDKALRIAESDLKRVEAKHENDSFEYAWACESLAETLMKRHKGNDWQRALEMFREASRWSDKSECEMEPRAIHIRGAYGIHLLNLNRIDDSISRLDDVIAEVNLNTQTLEYRAYLLETVGSIYLSYGDAKKGIKAFHRYAKLKEEILKASNTKLTFDQNELSRAYEEAEEYQKALELCEDLLKRDSIAPQGSLWNEIQLRRANCQLHLNKLPQAQAVLDEIADEDNLRNLKRGQIGLYKLLLGQMELASSDLSRAAADLGDAFELLEADPQSIWNCPHNHVLCKTSDLLMNALELQGDFESVKKWKERAEKYRPKR